jgi:hypothetical protein
MSEYRIVFNAQTRKFRIEQRRLWDWSFVMDDTGEQYATFDSYEAAQRVVCALRRTRINRNRRWQVVDTCCDSSSSA